MMMMMMMMTTMTMTMTMTMMMMMIHGGKSGHAPDGSASTTATAGTTVWRFRRRYRDLPRHCHFSPFFLFPFRSFLNHRREIARTH
jgi:hypothetical protein